MGAHTDPGAVIYACMDWRHMSEMLAAGRAVSFDFVNLCVWVKRNGGMGSLYRSRHELVFVFRNGEEQHRNNVQLGRFGRNRTNVWNYAGANGLPRKGRKRGLELHPTVKPIALVSDALLDATKRGDAVCSIPFAAAARRSSPPSAPAAAALASRSTRSMSIRRSRAGRRPPAARRVTHPGKLSPGSRPSARRWRARRRHQ